MEYHNGLNPSIGYSKLILEVVCSLSQPFWHLPNDLQPIFGCIPEFHAWRSVRIHERSAQTQRFVGLQNLSTLSSWLESWHIRPSEHEREADGLEDPKVSLPVEEECCEMRHVLSHMELSSGAILPGV